MKLTVLIAALVFCLVVTSNLAYASTAAAAPKVELTNSTPCTPGDEASTMSLDLPSGFMIYDSSELRLGVSLYNAESTELTGGTITVDIAQHRTTTRAQLDPTLPLRTPQRVADTPIEGAIPADSRRDVTISVPGEDLTALWHPGPPGPYRVHVTATFDEHTLHATTYLLWWPPDSPEVSPTPLLAVAPVTTDLPNLLTGSATAGPDLVQAVQPLLTTRGVMPLVDGALTTTLSPVARAATKDTQPAEPPDAATPSNQPTNTVLPDITHDVAEFASELLDSNNTGLLPWLNANPDIYTQLTGDPAEFQHTLQLPPNAQAVRVMSFETVPSDREWLTMLHADPEIVVLPIDAVQPAEGTAGQAASVWHLKGSDTARLVLTPNESLTTTVEDVAVAQHGTCPSEPTEGITSYDAAAARIAAELAVITLEQPTNPRTQVIRLPGTWTTAAAQYQHVMQSTLELPWVEATDLQGLLATPDIGAAQLISELPPTSTRYSDELASARDSLETLTVVDKALADTPQNIAWERAAAVASKSWDARPEQWRESLTKLQQTADARRAAIRLDIGAQINIVAEQVELPVTVYNGLDETVEVDILTNSDTPRLRTDDPIRVVIPPNSSQKVKLDLIALSDGQAELTAQVRSTDGGIVTQATGVEVRIRRMWESSAIVSGSIILALFVLLGVARGILRNRRHRKAV